MDGSQQQSSLDGLGTLDGSSLTAADGLLLHSTFSAGGQSQRGGSQYRTTGHIKALDMSVEEEDTEESFMIDDEFSSQILPDDYDVFMGNFPLPLPRIGERLLKVKYLGPAKWTTESELFPVHGLLHDHSRYIISLTCSLDHNPDYSKRIIFVVDTGSPFTYLTQEAIRALYEPPEVYDGRLDTFDVFIHSRLPANSVTAYKPHPIKQKNIYEAQVNLLGTDFLQNHLLSIILMSHTKFFMAEASSVGEIVLQKQQQSSMAVPSCGEGSSSQNSSSILTDSIRKRKNTKDGEEEEDDVEQSPTKKGLRLTHSEYDCSVVVLDQEWTDLCRIEAGQEGQEESVGQPTTTKKNGVRLTNPEYYCEPSIDALNKERTVDGMCRIEAGLTIGRFDYGSVFWPGPFEIAGDLNLDNVVHFRNKEVVVYPDKSKKPGVGHELNRFAEVSLDRVWPVDRQRKVIKDSEKLRAMGFRDMLEQLCFRMGATFRDYQYVTGTWKFAVDHFSKYGYLDEDDDASNGPFDAMPLQQQQSNDDGEKAATAKEQLKQNARLQTLVQKAGIPLRELQDSLIAAGGGQRSATVVPTTTSSSSSTNPLKRTPKLDFVNIGDTTSSADYSDIPDSFEWGKGAKRSRLDETHNESKRLLSRMGSKKDIKKTQGKDESDDFSQQNGEEQMEVKPAELVEREPVNRFVGLTPKMVSQLCNFSVLAIRDSVWPRSVPFQSQIARRSCRASFAQGLIMCKLPSNGLFTTLEIDKLDDIIPTVESIIVDHLRVAGELARLGPLNKGALLRRDPPSTLRRLFDAFVVDTYKVSRDAGICFTDVNKTAINSLSAILLASVDTVSDKLVQRDRFGKWLVAQLQSTNDWATELHSYKQLVAHRQQEMLAGAGGGFGGLPQPPQSSKTSAVCKNEPLFRAIYRCLVHGAVKEAAWLAENARFYSLAMLLSMWQASPPPQRIRVPMAKQLLSSRRVGGSSLQQNELPLVGGFLSGFPIPPSSSSQVSSSPPAGSGGFYERILGLLSTSWANIEVNQQMGDDDKATAQLIMTMALDSIREQRLNWIQILGVIVWYWSTPATSLLDCIHQLERLEQAGVVRL